MLSPSKSPVSFSCINSSWNWSALAMTSSSKVWCPVLNVLSVSITCAMNHAVDICTLWSVRRRWGPSCPWAMNKMSSLSLWPWPKQPSCGSLCWELDDLAQSETMKNVPVKGLNLLPALLWQVRIGFEHTQIERPWRTTSDSCTSCSIDSAWRCLKRLARNIQIVTLSSDMRFLSSITTITLCNCCLWHYHMKHVLTIAVRVHYRDFSNHSQRVWSLNLRLPFEPQDSHDLEVSPQYSQKDI